MRCQKLLFSFLIVFLFLTITNQTLALTYHLPKNTVIQDGLKIHFGDTWVSTSGTDMRITTYFENGWLNYTSNAGTQLIHNGSKPTAVYFDDVNQTEGDTWSYADGTVTVTPSGTDVGITWLALGNGNGNGEDDDPTVLPINIEIDTLLIQYLLAGDFVGFILACYTSKIGQGFYAILMLLVFGVLYNRTKSIALCSIVWLIVGGLMIATTQIVSSIAVILCAIGLAGILYSVFGKSSE